MHATTRLGLALSAFTLFAAAPATASAQSKVPAPAAVKPLRFVMKVPLRNKATDTVNPTCYSTIVERAGPPGWGGKGWLPAGSDSIARKAIDDLKAEFFAGCRAAGREPSSEKNLYFEWNQSPDGDATVERTKAKYKEDVTVPLR